MSRGKDPTQSEAAIAADWQLLDPPVSLVRLKSGRVLPAISCGTVDTVRLRGGSNMTETIRTELISSLKGGVSCGRENAAKSEHANQKAFETQKGNDKAKVAEPLLGQSEDEIAKGETSGQPLSSVSDSSVDNTIKKETVEAETQKQDAETNLKDEHISGDPPRLSSAETKSSNISGSSALYVSTRTRNVSSHDFAGEFQTHATDSRRARSQIRTEAVKLIDKHDGEACAPLKDDSVRAKTAPAGSSDTEHVNQTNEIAEKSSKNAVNEKQISASDDKSEASKAKCESTKPKTKVIKPDANIPKTTQKKPPKGKPNTTKLPEVKASPPKSSEAIKKENNFNSPSPSKPKPLQTKLNEAKTLDNEETNANTEDESNKMIANEENDCFDEHEGTNESDTVDTEAPAPSAANGFRLHLDDAAAVYPGIMSERFYREFRRDRLRTFPAAPVESDTAVQQKALLDLMSKGLGNFTTQMAEILIARIKPEYETLARQVGEEVKESAIEELNTLRANVATGETTITELRRGNAKLVETREKEKEALKKALETEKQKRTKEFEEYTQKIEKLMLDLEKTNIALQDKDKTLQKAKLKAKQEEQKRVKLQEEHTSKVEELKKEVEKAKCEISVIRAKKRIQSASSKQKGKGAPGLLVSHAGMYPRQWGQLKEIPYDEGDD